MSEQERALLEQCRQRIVSDNAAWERHMKRFHRRRKDGHLSEGAWDCLPYSAPYGDGLLNEIEDALGVSEAEQEG